MKKSTMTAMAYPPPPPPPSKVSRKTLIAVIVIVAIAAVAVGVYLATRSGGDGSGPSVTPTPTPSSAVTPTPAPTATPTSSGGANVAGASSLQFTTSITSSSGTSRGTYTYYAKNAGTSNMMIRIEFTDPSGHNFVYILNGALQKAWVQSGGQWTDISSAYASQWSSWNSAFTGYKNSLTGWSGVGDWTYTDPNGDTVRIYDITVNPSLADSLFQHS